MRLSLITGVFLSLLAVPAASADFKTLRRLEAPPPITVSAMPPDAKVNPAGLSKVVIQPREGEGWAAFYTVLAEVPEVLPGGAQVIPWEGGRLDADTASFARIFDEELSAAGFKSAGEASLFDRPATPDLQVGVLIDDIKGRFCMNCPNLFYREKVSAVVTMNARWEVYSSIRAQVVARQVTSTGASWSKRPGSSITPIVLDAFRENVRALLASESFRTAITASPTTNVANLSPIRFAPGPTSKRTVASSVNAVAAIFTGDGMGSGFLISSDGYLLTNHHVVGGAKYVKVRWSDGVETVGEVLRSDRRRDIAVVKADPGQRQALAVRTSAAALGEPVFAIGTPLQAKFQGTVTKGIVSASRVYDGTPFIQSDVSVNGGNSGGPLLDESGAVLGVTVSGIDISGAPVGINLFIPIDDALRALALQPVG